MKTLAPIYWLLGFIIFGLIVIETQNLSIVYNAEKSCNDRIETLKRGYGDYGWFKEKYNELTEKNRGRYVVTYDTNASNYNGDSHVVRRTIICENSLMPTLSQNTLYIVGCGTFEGVTGFNFTKR